MNSKLLNSIIISASILILFLLVLPLFDQTRILRNSIKEREAVLTEAQEISNRIIELNQGIDRRRNEVAKLDQLLPRQKGTAEILVNLESIVSASGMLLSELNLSEVSGLEEVKKINGSMKLSGSFASFMNFLDLLEKNLRLVEISTIDAAAQEVGGTQTINYDIRFEASYLSQGP